MNPKITLYRQYHESGHWGRYEKSICHTLEIPDNQSEELCLEYHYSFTDDENPDREEVKIRKYKIKRHKLISFIEDHGEKID